MTTAAAAGPFLRVEKGRLSAEEAAALAVVLLEATAGAADPAPPRPARACWVRPDADGAFCPGHSWQARR